MNKFERRSKESYNKKAINYDDTFDGKFTKKFKQIILDSLDVKDGDRLLDVACGNGRLLQMLSKKADIKGFGADISEKMIEEAKKLNPDMNFFAAGCDNLPFEDDFADIISVCASFHHFPNPSDFASEAGRVLKKGGKIFIAEIYLPGILRIIANPFVKLSKAGDVKFYSPKEIASIFEAHGFQRENALIHGFTELIILKKI